MTNICGETNFVVQYQDSPFQLSGLVLITGIDKTLFDYQILDWYSSKYDMDRSKLSGYFIESVNYKE